MALTVAELEGKIALEIANVREGAKGVNSAMQDIAKSMSLTQKESEKVRASLERAFDKRFADDIRKHDDAIKKLNTALDAEEKALKKVQDAQEKTSASAKGLLGTLEQMPGPIGSAASATLRWAGLLLGPGGLLIGLTATGVALTVFAKNMSDNIERLDGMSRQTGLSVAALQAFEHAASQAGESPEQLAQGLGQVNRAIGDLIAGKDAAARGFEAIGVPFRDMVKSGADVEEILEATAKQLKAIQDPTARAAAGMDLFNLRGKALQSVLEALATEGFDGYIRKLTEMGVVTSKETNKIAREFDAMMDSISTHMKSLTVTTGTFALTMFAEVRDEFNLYVAFITAKIDALIALVTRGKAAIGLATEEEVAAAQAIAAASAEVLRNTPTPAQAARERAERPPPQDRLRSPRDLAETADERQAREAAQREAEKRAKFLQENEAKIAGMLIQQREDTLREVAEAEADARKAADKELNDQIDDRLKILDKERDAIKQQIRDNEDVVPSLNLAADATLKYNDKVARTVSIVEDLSGTLQGGTIQLVTSAARWDQNGTLIVTALDEMADGTLTLRRGTTELAKANMQTGEGFTLYGEQVQFTTEQLDEAAATIARMPAEMADARDATQQFADGFKQAGQDIVDQFTNWEGIGRQTAGNLFQAFDETFFQSFKGNFDELGDVWQGFLDNLLRMLTQFMAAIVVQEFLSFISGGAFAGAGSILGGMFGGGGGAGGSGAGGQAAGVAGSIAQSAAGQYIKSQVASWLGIGGAGAAGFSGAAGGFGAGASVGMDAIAAGILAEGGGTAAAGGGLGGGAAAGGAGVAGTLGTVAPFAAIAAVIGYGIYDSIMDKAAHGQQKRLTAFNLGELSDVLTGARGGPGLMAGTNALDFLGKNPGEVGRQLGLGPEEVAAFLAQSQARVAQQFSKQVVAIMGGQQFGLDAQMRQVGTGEMRDVVDMSAANRNAALLALQQVPGFAGLGGDVQSSLANLGASFEGDAAAMRELVKAVAEMTTGLQLSNEQADALLQKGKDTGAVFEQQSQFVAELNARLLDTTNGIGSSKVEAQEMAAALASGQVPAEALTGSIAALAQEHGPLFLEQLMQAVEMLGLSRQETELLAEMLKGIAETELIVPVSFDVRGNPLAGAPGGAVAVGPGPGTTIPDRLRGGWIPGFAPGGWVSAGQYGADSVLARLARGEFVMNERSANFNPDFTEAYNRDPRAALASVAGGGGMSPAVLSELQRQTRAMNRTANAVEALARSRGARLVGDAH